MPSKTTTAAAALLGAVLLAAIGCEDDRPPPPRPMEGRGKPSQGSARSQGAEHEHEPDPVSPSHEVGGAGAGARGPGNEAQQGEQDQGPDLEAELREAIAAAEGCLPTDDPSLPDRVSVNATVHLSATGRVTRASASGSGLPTEATDCVEGRLEARTFSDPAPDGPRSASASYSWRFERTEPSERGASGSAESTGSSQGYGIQGPGGVKIQPSQGQRPSGPSGQAIEGPSGTPIGE